MFIERYGGGVYDNIYYEKPHIDHNHFDSIIWFSVFKYPTKFLLHFYNGKNLDSFHQQKPNKTQKKIIIMSCLIDIEMESMRKSLINRSNALDAIHTNICDWILWHERQWASFLSLRGISSYCEHDFVSAINEYYIFCGVDVKVSCQSVI